MPNLAMEANTPASTTSAVSFNIYETFASFMKNDEVLRSFLCTAFDLYGDPDILPSGCNLGPHKADRDI